MTVFNKIREAYCNLAVSCFLLHFIISEAAAAVVGGKLYIEIIVLQYITALHIIAVQKDENYS